ncbi:lysophospholipase D GDPD1-like isoform X1 [Rhopilema esculentum]|uniref:lysophospholipase D GDPD1-like isoform X1 n=1 Tax=Rhopilema esculentum TaxID=499914 RepID=UPI0031E0E712
MAAWHYVAAIAGSYLCTSLLLLRFPTILHKKKKNKIKCRHISHRGGAGENLENTMTAFRMSVECGTEMIELDVQLTADKQIVVAHDLNLTRTCGKDINISDLNFEDLPEMSNPLAVTFSNDKYCHASNSDRKIPLLKTVFDEFPNLPINLDVKTYDEELIELVHKMICDYDRKEITVWGNVNAKTVERLHKLDPDIPLLFSFKRCVILLLTFYTGLLPFIPLKESFLEVIMPSPILRWKKSSLTRFQRIVIRIVDSLFMNSYLFKHLERRGIQTFLWVLNEEEDFARAFDELGVAGVMTDYPTLLKTYLDQRDKKADEKETTQSDPLLSAGCRRRRKVEEKGCEEAVNAE